MQPGVSMVTEEIHCIDCISGIEKKLHFENGRLAGRINTETSSTRLPYIGAGLIDLQVNGINGIDFNDPSLTANDVVKATHYLLSKGITTFLPTVITNTDENILQILHTIYEACLADPLVNKCIWGIHLEGPFISPLPGARGAHDEKYIKPPDWNLFQLYRQAAPEKIKLVTLSPEWEESFSFIEQCRENKIIVSIGHSLADRNSIDRAVKAGATLCTHLGNAVPLMLPRHPNILWDLLATDDLYVCMIGDGIHIPDSFMKVVMKCKQEKTLLVSDATCFAGMPPGEYRNHIGGAVVLDQEKRVSLQSIPGMLAGAGKTLLENVETLMDHGIATLAQGWQMASVNVGNMLAEQDVGFCESEDLVMFEMHGNIVHITRVIKDGVTVYPS